MGPKDFFTVLVREATPLEMKMTFFSLPCLRRGMREVVTRTGPTTLVSWTVEMGVRSCLYVRQGARHQKWLEISRKEIGVATYSSVNLNWPLLMAALLIRISIDFVIFLVSSTACY